MFFHVIYALLCEQLPVYVNFTSSVVCYSYLYCHDCRLALVCVHVQVVEVLLQRGANKEHRNVSDYTPLSLAASGGYVNIIKLLLNYNAEINSR